MTTISRIRSIRAATLMSLVLGPTVTGSAQAQVVDAGPTITTGVEVTLPSFLNNGSISNTAIGNAAVYGDGSGTLVDFTNNGLIRSLINAPAVSLRVDSDQNAVENTFLNSSTGVIRSIGVGIDLQGEIGTFVNEGTVASTFRAIEHSGFIGRFVNSGHLSSAERDAIQLGRIGQFRNEADGEIIGRDDAVIIFSAGIIENAGRVSGGNNGLEIGSVDVFRNLAGGWIDGRDQEAVLIEDDVSRFENAGLLQSLSSSAVRVLYDVQTFTNSGVIRSLNVIDDADDAQPEAYAVSARQLGAFSNSGTIEGQSFGVGADVIDSFLNTGTIAAFDRAVRSRLGMDRFENRGLIETTDGRAVFVTGHILDGNNSGTIRTRGDFALFSGSDADSDTAGFVNSGLIEANGIGALFFGRTGTISNSGQIIGAQSAGLATFGARAVINTGLISTDGLLERSGGLTILGTVDRVDNSGTIQSLGRSGGAGLLVANGQTFRLDNSGRIIGPTGILIDTENPFDGATIHNSGLISGLDGVAIAFGPDGTDRLILADGSRILGNVLFGGGEDALDVSAYGGNALLRVEGLETLSGGDRVVFRNAVAGTDFEDINVVALDGFTLAGRETSAMVLQFATSVADQIMAGARSAPPGYALSYAPATDPILAVTGQQLTGPRIWGSAITGGRWAEHGTDSAYHAGLAAGAISQLDARTEIGVAAAYLSGDARSGEDRLQTDAVMAAVHGRYDLGGVAFDAALVAGYGSHQGERSVAAFDGADIASAAFDGYILAPSLGAMVPVLDTGSMTVNLRGEARYVASTISGFAETGSAAAVAVGEQASALGDARLGIEARLVQGDLVMTGRVGAYAQTSLGASTIAISHLGDVETRTLPQGSETGTYAGLGASADLGGDVRVNGAIDVSSALAGLVSASGRIGLEGRF
ncbi:autotransporter outer membrane beta-barrel domain-containing protein [Arsenicitalea aurantiaca]|nr:autotransporter outer membrane beta-barrel domain-containing protein [Arsenicitalea aurantiaca]